MATKPIQVVKSGYNGGKTVMDELGNTEHRQKVLADMESNDMGDMAKQVSTANSVPYTPKANNEAPATAPTNPNVNGGVDINGVDAAYKTMQDNLNAGTAAMMKLQQDRTDFEVKKIEQQKEEAKKDLEKELTAAYVDYQKQINPYGANAEQFASQGMSGTGYAESSRVKMYSAHQNRVAIAKESYNKTVVSYNNAMTEARLQNSTVLAQLAFDTLQKSLELSLQGLQYKNELLMRQDEINYNRKRDALADERYEEEKKYSREQDALANEIQYATLTGDYSKLEAKGWVIDYDRLNYELNSSMRKDALNEAVVAAEYGNFEPLEKLGIKVSDEYKEAFKKGLLNNGGYPFSDGETDFDPDYIPEVINPINFNQIINTPYYYGKINPDAQYGVFKNTTDKDGDTYQPTHVGTQPITWARDENGEGMYYELETRQVHIQDSPYETKTQKLWKTPDGKLWYWDGRHNQYEPVDGKWDVSYVKNRWHATFDTHWTSSDYFGEEEQGSSPAEADTEEYPVKVWGN